MLFEDQDYLKDTYRKHGLDSVLKHITRELEEVESLIFAVQGSLENQCVTCNEQVVAGIAGNQTFELKTKIDILLTALSKKEVQK